MSYALYVYNTVARTDGVNFATPSPYVYKYIMSFFRFNPLPFFPTPFRRPFALTRCVVSLENLIPDSAPYRIYFYSFFDCKFKAPNSYPVRKRHEIISVPLSCVVNNTSNACAETTACSSVVCDYRAMISRRWVLNGRATIRHTRASPRQR